MGREGVRVNRPAITAAYAIQPGVLRTLAENPVYRERGLQARFAYAAPKSKIGEREIAPAAVPDSIRIAYEQRVRHLASVQDDYVLPLGADAAALFQSWAQEIEGMLGEGGDLEVPRDWGAKLAGQTLRFAGVLHCYEYGAAGEIGRATMEAAIAIGKYLVPHAEYVLTRMTAAEKTADNDAGYLLRCIERHGWKEFTRSEAQHQCKRRFSRVINIDPPLAELTRRGYIRLKTVPSTGPGRPPSPVYEVNPLVFPNAGNHSNNFAPESDEQLRE